MIIVFLFKVVIFCLMKNLSRYCVSVLMIFSMFDVLQRGNGTKLLVALECFSRELKNISIPNVSFGNRRINTLRYTSLMISQLGRLLNVSGVDSINCNDFTVCSVYTCLHLFFACFDMIL